MRLAHRGVAARLGAGGSLALLGLALAACSPSAGSASIAPASAPATSGTAASSPTPAAGVSSDWAMYHGNPSHSGVSSSLPKVTGPLKVITSVKLDGAVYASPIVVGGIVILATENDSDG
jgi:hypothetical protein